MGRLLESTVTLLCVGIVLLMPPVSSIFNSIAPILGVPVVVVYIFGVWLLLVVGSILLASLSRRSE